MLAVYVAIGVLVVWFVITQVVNATAQKRLTVQCDGCGVLLRDCDVSELVGYTTDWQDSEMCVLNMAALAGWKTTGNGPVPSEHWCPACTAPKGTTERYGELLQRASAVKPLEFTEG